MTDLAKLAAGLTEAQKRALQYAIDNWCHWESLDGRTLNALERKGLVYGYVSPRDFRETMVAVSQKGQALRRHLLDQEKRG